MYRITAALLVFVIAFQAFYNVGVTAYWLANRAYIAAELCINRDKPALHCDGKCYLKKKMAEAPGTAPARGESGSFKFEKGIELAEAVTDWHICFSVPRTQEHPALVPGQKQGHGLLLEKGIFRPPAAA